MESKNETEDSENRTPEFTPYILDETDLEEPEPDINQRNKILEEKKVLSAALSEIGKLKQDLNELRQIVEKYINQKC